MPFSLKARISLGFLAALLVMTAIAVLSHRSTVRLLETMDRVSDTEQSILALRSIQADLSSARATARGYFITGDSSSLQHINAQLQAVDARLNELKTRDFYPGYKKDVAKLDSIVQARLSVFHERLRVYRSAGLAGVIPLMKGDVSSSVVDDAAGRIEEGIRKQQSARQGDVARFSRRVLRVIALGGLVSAILLIIGNLIIFNETARRAKAYRLLQEREDRVQDLLESMSELIQLTQPDGRLTNVNGAWLKRLGYTEGNFRNIDIVDVVHPDYRERWRDAVAEALEGRRVSELAVDFMTKQGSRVKLVGTLSCRFNEDKQPESIRGIFRDVTDLLEQEHRNQQFLEGIPLGVFVVDKQGKPIYANSSSLEILGRGILGDEDAGELAEIYNVYRAGTTDIYPTKDLPVVRALSGEHVYEADLEIQRPDRRVPIEVTAAPVYSSEGEIVGAVAAFSDIGARREVEKLKDELISVVSHELRTPLTSVRGALGLVGTGRLGQLNDQGKKMIDIAVADTDRLVRLINDMLDIERMQSGRIEMHKATCDASEIVAKAIQPMEPTAQKANVRIEANIATASPVWCDPDRIVQTLTNLLGNAIKFSPAGGVVKVDVRDGATGIEFRISDKGRGIPKEKIESIFERFQQVDASDAREKGGAGLGLAISRSIVVQHGGRIWAESDGATGSTFAFTIPKLRSAGHEMLLLLAENDPESAKALKSMLESDGYRVKFADSDRAALEMAERNAPSIVLVEPTKLRETLTTAQQEDKEPLVLLVEDDANLMNVMIAQFDEFGLKTIHAANGSQAIRMVQEHKPDLLVLDLMLPEKDGFAVVDWLRQHDGSQQMPLVVYTALELEDEQKEQLKLGPSVFMTKSRVQPNQVAQQVAQLFERVGR